ncbi:hypothetical protein OS493_038544 [Desmophyllum pertusum]|uniref:Uncharacterized protein n=1 Tax=Desmophyllum pertusum TaxID=174260 RepID=A0A9W9ZIB1_9CNID|nr:hypothetical protein OS493_038544 [Desmophyllum pertusum]
MSETLTAAGAGNSAANEDSLSRKNMLCTTKHYHSYNMCLQIWQREDKEHFYQQLQGVIGKAPRRGMLILMEDINAKVGSKNNGEFRMKLTARRIVGGRRSEKIQHSEIEGHGGNRFAALAEEEVHGEDVDIMWQHCKDTFTDTCKEVLGYRQSKRKEWISEDTWKGIEGER